MFKYLKAMLVAIAFVAAPTSPALANDVNLSVPNWSTAKVVSYLLKALIEEEFGLKVGLVPSTNPVIFKAMGIGKGDIDVHPEVWLPNQKDLVKKYVEEDGTVALAKRSSNAFAGFCVDKKSADAHGLKSVYDLSNPDISKVFDSDGDGKGEFWVGAAGWAGTNVDRVRAISYGIGEVFELVIMDETLGVARIKKSGDTGTPVATICYGPHHMFNLAELLPLEEPAYEESKWQMVQPQEDPDWLSKSHVEVSWPPVKLHIAYSKRIERDLPEVASLLEGVQLDTDTLSEFSYLLIEQKQDPDKIAKDWIAANRDRVGEWMSL